MKLFIIAQAPRGLSVRRPKVEEDVLSVRWGPVGVKVLGFVSTDLCDWEWTWMRHHLHITWNSTKSSIKSWWKSKNILWFAAEGHSLSFQTKVLGCWMDWVYMLRTFLHLLKSLALWSSILNHICVCYDNLFWNSASCNAETVRNVRSNCIVKSHCCK